MRLRERSFILVPLVGYAGLWLLGTVLFLVYFAAYGISWNESYNQMVTGIPSVLAIITVPASSFVSYYLVTRRILRGSADPPSCRLLLALGLVSVAVAFGLDLLITVELEGVDIRRWPMDAMYLGAYLVIVPAVVLAGRVRHEARARPARLEGSL